MSGILVGRNVELEALRAFKATIEAAYRKQGNLTRAQVKAALDQYAKAMTSP